MKNGNRTTAQRAGRRFRIVTAALALALAGPLVADFAVPRAAEAQVEPDYTAWRWGRIYVCLPYTCWTWFCCGRRADA